MPRSSFLFAIALTGCFPGMVGGGGGGGGGGTTAPKDTRPQPMAPATLEEHVAHLKKESTHVFKIDRSLAAADDLYVTLRDTGTKRLAPIHSQWGSAVDGYRSIGYGGLIDDKLCFVHFHQAGKVGERKALYDAREYHAKNPAFVYAVEDLASLKGPAWPAPKHAAPLEAPEIIHSELDHRDERVMILQMCAAKPDNIASARYVIMVQHTDLGERLLAQATPSTDKFDANSLFVWKIEGDAAPRSAAKPEPKPTGNPDARQPEPDARSARGMSLVKSTVRQGESVKVKFSPRLEAKSGEKYWITIVEAGAGDTAYTSYKYLVDEASIELAAPAVAGDYEVRLHGNYPTKTYNLIGRAKLTVK